MRWGDAGARSGTTDTRRMRAVRARWYAIRRQVSTEYIGMVGTGSRMYVVRGPMRDGGWAFHFRLRLMMLQRGCVASGSCAPCTKLCVRVRDPEPDGDARALVCDDYLCGGGRAVPIRDRTATRTDSIVETSTHVTHIASSMFCYIVHPQAQPHPSSYHLESSLTLYCSVFAVYLCAARVATLCSLRRVSHASKPRQAPDLARPQKTNPPGAPLRPLHRRRWLPSPWIVSNNRPHISHGYCPNSFIIAGPAAPER